MANYTPGYTTAETGYSTTKPFEQVATSFFYQQLWPYTKDYAFVTNDPTERGWLRGRRPFRGQQFPRGIYNK